MSNKKFSMAARALAIGMVTALVLVGTAMGEVSRTGLIGEWHFEGDAKDTSGSGNDGTIYGATFVDGKFGKALSFNGVDDYVDAGTANPANGNKVTFAAWVKTTALSAESGIYNDNIITKGDDATANSYGIQLSSSSSSVGNAWATMFVRMGSRPWVNSPTGLLTSGAWHHIVGVIDGQTFKIYVDGIFRGSDTFPGSISSSSNSLWIGGQNRVRDVGYNYYFKGLIDEVLIYNRALSDEEIKSIYDSTITKSPSLTLTKSLSPSTITEGDSITVTLRVENTGGDAKSVKITDAIPQGFNLISGSASQEYAALKATEFRTFQYTAKATGTGRFVSDFATVTYQDDKGNSYSGASNSATITVQASASAPQQQATAQPQQQASPAAQPKMPGFGAILAGIGIILALALRRR